MAESQTQPKAGFLKMYAAFLDYASKDPARRLAIIKDYGKATVHIWR